MTDATALVDRLIGVAKSLPKERFFDLFDLLVQEGAPPAEANTTVNMCQAAFGRAFLSDFGISFSNRYFKFAPDGTILEEGALSEHPVYLAAERLAPIALKIETLSYLAMASGEVQSINELLNKGSDPANLVTAPMVYFDGEPTEEGMRKAHDLLQRACENAFQAAQKEREEKELAEKELAQKGAANEQGPMQEKKRPWWKLF